MKLTTDRALKILGLGKIPTLPDLKAAYRKLIRQWHPDLNPDQSKKATEKTQEINAAYDHLEGFAQSKKGSAEAWSKQVFRDIKVWQKAFQKEWRNAHATSISGKKGGAIDAGMHYRTCIEDFRRNYIQPPREWFVGVLYPNGDDEARKAFQEHLLAVAPNRLMRESYARQYHALEFGDGLWTFYLPASKEMLSSSYGK